MSSIRTIDNSSLDFALSTLDSSVMPECYMMPECYNSHYDKTFIQQPYDRAVNSPCLNLSGARRQHS